MGILAGEHGSPGRSARGRGAETEVEPDSLAGHAVKGGRSHHLVAINARMRPAPIVGQAIEDIGTRVGCSSGQYAGHEEYAGKKIALGHGGSKRESVKEGNLKAVCFSVARSELSPAILSNQRLPVSAAEAYSTFPAT